MSLPTSIFWPTDLQRATGHCYGWRKPALCVATVSQTLLDEPPLGTVLLGTCTFKTRLKLDFPDVTDFTLIYYHRHTAYSLRFYALREPQTRNSELTASLRADFTRVTRVGGLNSVVIDQFNSTSSFEPRHGVEISKRIFDLMELVLYLPKRALLLVPPLYGITAFSSTLQQIDVRSKQVLFLAQEVEPLRASHTSSVAVYSERYTNLFNTVWLILNDITIGIAFGSFLCDNDVVLADKINSVIEVFLNDWVRWALQWLDSWPAGLKLNTELSRFYAHTFSDLVSIWGHILNNGAPHLPTVLYICGIASCIGGMTVAIALLSDLIGLLTVHISLCYYLSRILYARFLRTAGSLWNLFRGKRYNALRERTDNWEYDMDQLLFGTILFTLLAFLFPTVLAYYSLFALLRFCTILLNAALETQLAFMNHFPLFALMLRVKDPWRLPHDVYIAVTANPSRCPSSSGNTVSVKVPVTAKSSLRAVRLWRKLAAHYNPLRLLWLVLTGGLLGPIPRDRGPQGSELASGQYST
ncbi:N-acetylglucosaminyl transferase component Gpi1 [Mycena chlorophos]|uniref:N-acetylglucosaminyl transferase component Gpi1 n=1 Tax=Mycena chlorophos TaxID=658473 RepID=A0A8H6S4V1_MYCCL|nr:N-acetylglucosaminyl transferase component Gpi1 [Mycena chlorophos]